jgi:hypothetical protein
MWQRPSARSSRISHLRLARRLLIVRRMNKRWIMIGLCAALGAGCSKKSETSGSSTGDKTGGDDKTAAMPAEVAAWMPKGATEAWQGAWASRLTLRTSGTISMAGDPAAIEVKGDKARVFDGKTESELGFAIDSPCTASFKQTITEGSMKGGTSTHTKQFLLKDGKVIAAEGAVGYRKGKTAIVCTSGMDKLATLDEAGKCKTWSMMFDKWQSKDTTCTWSTADGKDVLTVGTGDWSTKVIADGDLLQSEQFSDAVKQGLHVQAKSYDEAKATVTAKVKENDPGEQAKAAGGKVGDTSTIVSLGATYAADKASLEGKPLELTAQYFSSSSSTSNGVTSYAVSLVDSKDSTKLTLTCYTKEEVKGFKQYDKLTVKGTVKESFGRPSLEPCTVAKAP